VDIRRGERGVEVMLRRRRKRRKKEEKAKNEQQVEKQCSRLDSLHTT
jgi:antirestriction protein ArdC